MRVCIILLVFVFITSAITRAQSLSVSLAGDDLTNEGVEIQVSSTGAGSGGDVIVHGGGSEASGSYDGSTSVTFDHLEDGVHAFWAEQFSSGGTLEVVSNVVTCEVDKTPPMVSANLDALPAKTKTAALNLSMTFFDKNWAGGFIKCGTKQETPGSESGIMTFSITLVEGENKLKIEAEDGLGNAMTPSAEKTIILDTGAPTVKSITLTPKSAEEDKFYKAESVKVEIEFEDASEMDTTKNPNVWLYCTQGSGRLNMSPDAPASWSAKKFTCYITVPAGTGVVVDGTAQINVSDFYDEVGNKGTTVQSASIPLNSTHVIRVDTTPPKIDMENATMTDMNIKIPLTDNIWPLSGGTGTIQGSGLDTTKEGFEMWIDANGNGTVDEKETFNIYSESDTASNPACKYEGNYVNFYPSLNPDWKVYTADQITVKITKCRDITGNVSPVVSKVFSTNLNLKPRASFVYWSSPSTPEENATPPSNATTPDPYQNIKLIFYRNADTNSPLDKSSVVLRVNGIRYGIANSGSPDQSPALTTNDADTVEITFAPEAAIPKVKFPNGIVVAELLVAKDQIGKNIDPITTTFYVNMGKPTVQFVRWENTTPAKEKTPPAYVQGSAGITPFKDQQIVFRITPDTTSKLKIDTNEIILKVNNSYYAPATSSNQYASAAMTVANASASGSTTRDSTALDVTFNPSNCVPPLTFADGIVTAEVVKAQDIHGNKAVNVSTQFYVDTTAPTFQAISPQAGFITFDTGQIVSLSATDTAAQGMVIQLEVKNGTTPTGTSIDGSITYSDDNKTAYIFMHPNGPVHQNPLQNGAVEVSGTIKDLAGNSTTVSYTFFCLTNPKVNITKYPGRSATAEISVTGSISGIGSVTNAASYLNVVHQVNGGTAQIKPITVGGAADENRIATAEISCTLSSFTNTISFYLMDNLGNRTMDTPSISVIWDLSAPSNPHLTLDLPGTKKTFIGPAAFRWQAVADTSYYILEIAVDEGMNTVVRTFKINDGTYYFSTQLSDSPYSTYYARMRAYDNVGNIGPYSNVVKFMVDLTDPKVEKILVEDTTPSSNNTPVYPNHISPGDLKVSITYTEAMDSSIDMTVSNRVRLYFKALKKYIPVTKGSWTSDRVWEGTVNPDTIPSNPRWSGEFYIETLNAQDVAGHVHQYETSSAYYLDTAPMFETPKMFSNPLDEKEIMISVKVLEKLNAAPVCMLNSTTQISMNAHSDDTYIGSYRISETRISSADVTFSGTDLQGNVGHWPESYSDLTSSSSAPRMAKFAVEKISPDGGTIQSADSIVQLLIPPDAVKSEIYIPVIPQEIKDRSEAAPQKTRQKELITIKEPYQFSKTKLLKPALVKYALSESEYTENKALFVYDGTHWIFCGNTWENGFITGYSSILGTFAVFEDREAPEIMEVLQENQISADSRDVVVISAPDFGSGLKYAHIVIDDKSYTVQAQDAETIVFEPEFPFEEGEHTISVIAADHCGNMSAPQQSKFYAAGSLAITSTRVFPNPATDEAYVSYRLNKAPNSVKLSIYDVNGDRLYSDSQTGAANGEFIWYLTNDQGEDVASGVYYYTLKTSGDSDDEETGKIIVVR